MSFLTCRAKNFIDWEFYDFTLDVPDTLRPVFFIRQYKDHHYYKFIYNPSTQRYSRNKSSSEELKRYISQCKKFSVQTLPNGRCRVERFNIGNCEYGF